MIANYHAHTTRCHHAIGTEQEYVESAIRRGLKIFGFSDHSPQYFPGDYYSYMRMRPYELTEYCAEVRRLQREYRDQIQIPLGLEVEYYPISWGELLPRIQDAGVEYIILGQHWLGNEMDEPAVTAATSDAQYLRRYCHQVCTAMETGKFTYLAHPDYVNFVGDVKIYRQHMRDLCRTAKQIGIPMEVNLLGIASGRHYPNERLLEVIAEEDCPVILGIDAHAPKHIDNLEYEKTALELVHRYDLKLLDTVALRKI